MSGSHSQFSTLHSPLISIPPGYKQTEAGVLPEDWGAVALQSITPPNRKNAIVDGPFGSNLKSIHYRKSGIPIITSGFVTDGTFHADTYDYVDRSKFLEERRSAVSPGDIVMAKIGERCGASAILPHNHETGILSGNALKITVDESHNSTAYIWQVLWNMHESGKLECLRTVGAQPALSMANLKKHKIPVPPTRDEQRAIAEALSDVDALLGGLDRLIAKKRDLKQATMQQLLTGQTRLPGFHSEWEMKRLGEIADIKTGPFGSSLHESDYVQDGTPIITVEHLGEFGVEHRNLPMVSDHDRQRLRGYSLEIGDIVFSRVGSVDRNALIRPSEAGWLFSGRLLRVRPDKDKAFAQFLSYQFHGEAFKGLVRSVAVGQTMACLNTQILKGIIVKLPSVPEQTAIAEVLSEMDAELAGLEQRREKTRALKQAMMQELLTGRIRLV
ncbi:restriction endonuclease subunit S [Nitrospira sp. BLG_2]|uniref:restriction endonuclease subunit S n=1 Tax=Nitrospira sp. BLG_2 TaxID=3397507 RepID=UPI003B9CD8A2